MAPSRIDEPEDGAGTAAALGKNAPELKSKWPDTYDLRGSNLPCRLEGEVADLVVLGTVPPEIDGTFYRVSSKFATTAWVPFPVLYAPSSR